jgi:diguanylate cyclase (GGDEF)-like protein
VIATPSHPREDARLAALKSLELLDTESEERFDRLTRLAQRLLGVPIALVSLIDDDRPWFKSNQGLGVPETPRSISFCGHAVANDDDLIVNDALDDARFVDKPLVTDDPGIRSYAGVPLRVKGLPVGTLCAIDVQPRTFDQDDLAVLRDLAGLAELAGQEMALRRDSLLDHLTGLLSRRGLKEVARVVLGMAARDGKKVTLAFGDIDGLKTINDTFGHAEGDRAIIEIANMLAATFRSADAVARLSGDEFCVLLVAGPEGFADLAARVTARWTAAVEARNAEGSHPYRLGMSLGVAGMPAHRDLALAALIAEADEMMYVAKSQRRAEQGR